MKKVEKIFSGETKNKVLLVECIRVPSKEEIKQFRLQFFEGIKKGDIYTVLVEKLDVIRYVFWKDDNRFCMTRLGFKKYFKINKEIEVRI